MHAQDRSWPCGAAAARESSSLAEPRLLAGAEGLDNCPYVHVYRRMLSIVGERSKATVVNSLSESCLRRCYLSCTVLAANLRCWHCRRYVPPLCRLSIRRVRSSVVEKESLKQALTCDL